MSRARSDSAPHFSVTVRRIFCGGPAGYARFGGIAFRRENTPYSSLPRLYRIDYDDTTLLPICQEDFKIC